MTYQEILDYLYRLGHEMLAADYRLERIECALGELNRPQLAFPSILIAGTNGKGSVAAMVDSILRAASWSAGLYTSPHLINIRERIKVAGRDISPEAFARHATAVFEAAHRVVARGAISSMPTFFEHVTATGFSFFREEQIDVAVVEVGLGGRLDATNVVPPVVSALTRIDLDHTPILGSTLEEIAAEKAAIIKPGAAAVIAPQHSSVAQVILRRCQECGVAPRMGFTDPSRLWIHDVDADGHYTFSYRSQECIYERIRLALRGQHQIENAIVAIEIIEALRQRGCEVPPEAIIAGLEQVAWPGRLETLNRPDGRGKHFLGHIRFASKIHEAAPVANPLIVADGAHNLSGVEALRRYLEDFSLEPLTLVFGVMRDKPIEEMAAILFPLAQQVILTRVQDERAADVDRLGQLGRDYDHATWAETVQEAMQRALILTPSDGMICVAGSLYLVGAVKHWWSQMVESASMSGNA